MQEGTVSRDGPIRPKYDQESEDLAKAFMGELMPAL